MEDSLQVMVGAEEDFIHNYGVNKGYFLSYPKVTNCLFISSEAKELYGHLKSFAYGNKHSCFPSQTLLGLGLGWTRNTVNKYTQELRDSGLIETVSQGANRPLIYRIKELQDVPVLTHSEIVWSLLPEEYNQLTEFIEVVKKYRQSDLFKEVSKSEHPEEYIKDITYWFKCSMAGQEPKIEILPNETQKAPLPNIVPTIEGVEAEKAEGKGRKRSAKDYRDTDISEWNTNHFCQYFEAAYYAEFKTPYMTSRVDRKLMKQLVEGRDNNEVLKLHIDNFMRLEQLSPKNIGTFRLNFVQSSLDNYLKNGVVPPYKKAEAPKKKSNDDFDDSDFFVVGGGK